MSRFIRSSALLAGLLVIGAVAATAGPAAGSGPQASASKNCHLSRHERGSGLGATYTRYVHVRRTSCRSGKKVVKAFNRCRHRHGKSGHCNHRVYGYRCRERRPARDNGPTEYDGVVGCRKGSRRVSFRYTQFKE